MTKNLATLLLTTVIASLMSATTAMAQDTPKHFSKRIEIPRAERLKNFSNNEDTPVIVNNRNKNRHERKRGRNPRQKTNTAAESDARTTSITANKSERNKTARRQNAGQQSRNRDQDTQIINEVVKGLLND